MVTKKTAIKESKELISELRHNGYKIPKASIFGSIAKGNTHKDSDIDLALWDEKFTGCLAIDYEPVKGILRKYSRIELHTFNVHETDSDNPFIGVINREGLQIIV